MATIIGGSVAGIDIVVADAAAVVSDIAVVAVVVADRTAAVAVVVADRTAAVVALVGEPERPRRVWPREGASLVPNHCRLSVPFVADDVAKVWEAEAYYENWCLVATMMNVIPMTSIALWASLVLPSTMLVALVKEREGNNFRPVGAVTSAQSYR